MRVGVRPLAFFELLDLGRSDLEVLLQRTLSLFSRIEERRGSRLGRLTLGVRLFSSSSADMCFSARNGAAAAFSLFFSSCCRCFCLFFSSLLLGYNQHLPLICWLLGYTDLTISPVASSRCKLAIWPSATSTILTENELWRIVFADLE